MNYYLDGGSRAPHLSGTLGIGTRSGHWLDRGTLHTDHRRDRIPMGCFLDYHEEKQKVARRTGRAGDAATWRRGTGGKDTISCNTVQIFGRPTDSARSRGRRRPRYAN